MNNPTVGMEGAGPSPWSGRKDVWIAESATTLLVEVADVLSLGVVKLLITKGIAIELIEQTLDALFLSLIHI